MHFQMMVNQLNHFFIFPNSLRDTTINDEQNSYNDLGHLTPQIFLSWIEKHLELKGNHFISFIQSKMKKRNCHI